MEATSKVGTAGKRKRDRHKGTDVAYGPYRADNHLDIWRRPDLSAHGRAPVLIHVPGGCWTITNKLGQGYPLMCRLVELGWVCVSINYRGSPGNAWPAHIIDVKGAIAWVRDNIADYGGDPDFIAMAGGSAGAHLSSLAALTPNDPRWQPGFEGAYVDQRRGPLVRHLRPVRHRQASLSAATVPGALRF